MRRASEPGARPLLNGLAIIFAMGVVQDCAEDDKGNYSAASGSGRLAA
jgi:hypothetical protein